MRHVIGCMTGTSIDALDAALVEVEGEGLAMTARFVRGHTVTLGGLAPRLRALAGQCPMTAGDIAALAHDFARLHAGAVHDLLAGERCDLVCVHGQTVYHKPPLSWQLMQPAPIARALGVPVVYDLRQGDLAVGGQGAPITPIADWILFRRHADPLTIVNLGGFANFTSWDCGTGPDEELSRACPGGLGLRGGDICACNQLLDALARRRLDRPYDESGKTAASGVADRDALADLLMLLRKQSGQRRSLGTGDELASWIERSDALPGGVVLRTACEGIAGAITERTGTQAPLVLGGGGALNHTLAGEIRRLAGSVRLTSDLDVPIEHRESACFAVLGALCRDGIPITIPGITHCKEPAPLSGAWVFP